MAWGFILRFVGLLLMLPTARPEAFTLNQGDIVIADPRDIGVPGLIVRVDPGTGAQEIIADNLVQPYWVAIDARGDLLVSDRGLPGRIVRIDRTTGGQSIVSEGQFFGSPYGLAIAPDGQLFVTERGTRSEPHNRIIRVDPSTGVQTLVMAPSSPLGAFVAELTLTSLEGIAVAPNGDIFVVDQGASGGNDGRVIRVDQVSGQATVVSEAGYFVDPRGIVVEPNGRLLVADPDAFSLNGGIIEIDPSTQTQAIVSRDSAFNNPNAIAIDAGGNLIVTDDGIRAAPDRVLRVERSTGAVMTVSSSGNFVHPWGVAIVGGPCGNGTLDPGEECDDGNVQDGDCCSARCKLEGPSIGCIERRLDELSDIVATQLAPTPFRESLLKALRPARPAIQLAAESVHSKHVTLARRRLLQALQALRRFKQRLDSRAGRRHVDPHVRSLLRENAEARRADIRSLRNSL